MISFCVEKYSPSDLKAIMLLFYDTVHSINAKDYTQEQLTAWTSNIDKATWNRSFLDNYTYVAKVGNIVVGFGDIEKTGYLNRLFVHKDYQRQGIATALCNILESVITVDTIYVHASISAKDFFIKRGYKLIQEQVVVKANVALKNYIMAKNIFLL